MSATSVGPSVGPGVPMTPAKKGASRPQEIATPATATEKMQEPPTRDASVAPACIFSQHYDAEDVDRAVVSTGFDFYFASSLRPPTPSLKQLTKKHRVKGEVSRIEKQINRDALRTVCKKIWNGDVRHHVADAVESPLGKAFETSWSSPTTTNPHRTESNSYSSWSGRLAATISSIVEESNEESEGDSCTGDDPIRLLDTYSMSDRSSCIRSQASSIRDFDADCVFRRKDSESGNQHTVGGRIPELQGSQKIQKPLVEDERSGYTQHSSFVLDDNSLTISFQDDSYSCSKYDENRHQCFPRRKSRDQAAPSLGRFEDNALTISFEQTGPGGHHAVDSLSFSRLYNASILAYPPPPVNTKEQCDESVSVREQTFQAQGDRWIDKQLSEDEDAVSVQTPSPERRNQSGKHVRVPGHTEESQIHNDPLRIENEQQLPSSRNRDEAEPSSRARSSTARKVEYLASSGCYDRSHFVLVDGVCYEHAGFLGRGGCGDVYRVTEVMLGEPEKVPNSCFFHYSGVDVGTHQSQGNSHRNVDHVNHLTERAPMDGNETNPTSKTRNYKYCGPFPIIGYGEDYAYKIVMAKNEQSLERCLEEVKILKQFEGHENIIQMKGAVTEEKYHPVSGNANNQPESNSQHTHKSYTVGMVLQLAHTDYRKFLDNVEQEKILLKMDEILEHYEQMVNSVNSCHDKGIVHFDLKPDNYLCIYHDEVEVRESRNDILEFQKMHQRDDMEKSRRMEILLSDFGLAACVVDEKTHVFFVDL